MPQGQVGHPPPTPPKPIPPVKVTSTVKPISDDELLANEKARLEMARLRLLDKDVKAGRITKDELERALKVPIKVTTTVSDLREKAETKARRKRIRQILKEQGRYSPEAVRALMENPMIKKMDPSKLDPEKVSIVIPGIEDIIVLPGSEKARRQMAREREEWYETHRPTSPDFTIPITKLINKIDDAQDIAYTAMMVLRPILKRIPKEWNNPLSWVLSVIDIAGVLVALLSNAQKLKLKKDKYHDMLKRAGLSKQDRFLRVSEYKTRINYTATIIQGAQALETITGYGLRLGPIMGMLSDLGFAGLRAILTGQLPDILFQAGEKRGGRSGHIKIPDIGEQIQHEDEFEKAIIYLSQPIITQVAAQQIRPQDHALIMLANMLAIQTVTETYPMEWVRHRIDRAENQRVPSSMHTGKWIGPTTTYADLPAIISGLEAPYRWHIGKKSGMLPETQQTMRQVERDGGNAMLDWWGGEKSLEEVTEQPYITAGWAVEYGIYPPENVKPEQVLAWLTRADEMAFNTHRRIPDRWMIEQAAAQHMGGWVATR